MDDFSRLITDATRLRSYSHFNEIDTDCFLAVINLPIIGYDEIMVTIDTNNIEVSAVLKSSQSIYDSNEDNENIQNFTTKVRLPDGLDVAKADAVYKNGSVSVWIPYSD